MKSKKIIIGVVAIIAIIGIILIIKTIAKRGPKKAVAAGQIKKDLDKTAAKRVISKGKGGLTVIMRNSKNTEVPMRIKAFKVLDSKSSVYAASTVGSRMQELVPGVYDIEIDTVPQKIYKNIKVEQGRERKEDLGCVTGSMFIKTINSKKTPAYYPVRILYPNTNEMVTAYMTNKAMEIIPGVYDFEIGTSPRQYKKNVKIVAGKEVIVDLGCLTGSLLVKAVDENKKNMRYSVRVTKADTNEIISSSSSNKPIELGKGTYNIDLLSYPKQSKKDVKVNVGEEKVVEFTVQSPPKPQAVKAKQQLL
ncbi:MAG: hypothetical protein HY957_08400 [Nitrospirae bacterium]|nr:hypothetical protein [Nitrospirota bacterium]